MLFPYRLSNYSVHDQASLQVDDAVATVTTPDACWAYAAEFRPAFDGGLDGQTVGVRARAKVKKGAVGFGILVEDGSAFIREIQVEATGDERDVEIAVPEGTRPGSFIVRNTSTSGPSVAEFRFHLLPGDVMLSSGLREIDVSPTVFEGFKNWSGTVEAGYFSDWTGVKTRADVWAFTPEDVAVFNNSREEAPEVERDGEHVVDWAPLAEAVRDSRGVFRMAALGAGWGRWLSAGGALARQIGRDYRLVGVEADAKHFAWMKRHFAENGFDPSRYTLIEAAAAGQSGFCDFAVGDSQSWYGQAIFTDPDDPRPKRRVRAVTLADVLDEASPLDYLHMDIQGAELDVLSSHADRLDREVKMVNIGTHSSEIENGLRLLFERLGWRCSFDIALNTEAIVHLGKGREAKVHFGDGAQVWRNPKL